MKTCISTYSYENEMDKGNFTRFDAIDYTKKLGMDGVEIVLNDHHIPEGETFLSYTKALTEHAREIGLDVPILTLSLELYSNPDATFEKLKERVDIASECGIPMIRHDIAYGYKDGDFAKSPKHIIDTVAPYIRSLAEYAESKGVKTTSENHGRIMQDPERLDALFTAVNHKNYGLLFDMCNFGSADVEADKAISKLIQYVSYVHAKDAFIRNGMSYDPGRGFGCSRGGAFRRSTIFGHGDVPTFQVLAALKDYCYDGYVSIEFEGMEDNLPALEIGAENLRRMIDDLER